MKTDAACSPSPRLHSIRIISHIPNQIARVAPSHPYSLSLTKTQKASAVGIGECAEQTVDGVDQIGVGAVVAIGDLRQLAERVEDIR